jgi:hypothetical protein
MNDKTLRVFLTGGLGNQIFQLAAALHYAGSRRIELDVHTAEPRKNKSGEAEILSLDLPPQIHILKKNEGAFVRKVFGFNLRSGYLPRNFEKKLIFKAIRRLASTIALGVTLRRFYQIIVSNNLGDDSKIDGSDRNEIIIGYFQTYKFSSEVTNRKKKLFGQLNNQKFQEFKSLAAVEKPLLVHVRLGDYQLEEQFGILTSEYYKTAIEHAWQRGEFDKIWLFSDQPQEALQQIPQQYRGEIRLIEDDDLDSAETLQIMSLCQGYVIANSSFSWWAASLSDFTDPIVVTPKPWFIQLSEPTDLMPPHWNRIDGFGTS